MLDIRNEGNGEVGNEILGLGGEYTEILLDSHLSEGLFRDFPIVRTIFSSYKIIKGVKDYYAVKKLVAFFNGYKRLTKDELDKAMAKFGAYGNGAKLGERVLLIIDHMDDINKAELVGRLMKLLADDDVDVNFYLRLCHLLDKCFYDDIRYLSKFDTDETIILSQNKQIPTEVLDNLFSNGFIGNYGFDGGTLGDDSNNGTRYGLNKYGKKLRKVL